MHIAVYVIVRCLSVCYTVNCVETTELIITQLALHCSLATQVYGHR